MKIKIELYSTITEKEYEFEHKYNNRKYSGVPIYNWLIEDVFPEIHDKCCELIETDDEIRAEYADEIDDPHFDTTFCNESICYVNITAEHDYEELYRTNEYDPDAFDTNEWREQPLESVFKNFYLYLETKERCLKMPGWKEKHEW